MQSKRLIQIRSLLQIRLLYKIKSAKDQSPILYLNLKLRLRSVRKRLEQLFSKGHQGSCRQEFYWLAEIGIESFATCANDVEH